MEKTLTPDKLTIAKINTGKYIGYIETKPGKLPALCFDHGFFIQEHADPQEVGWHQMTSGTHNFANIKKTSAQQYRDAKEWLEFSGDMGEVSEFIKKFRQGIYNDNESIDSVCFALCPGTQRLFEGKLIKAGDKAFKEQYSDAYATGVTQKGRFAIKQIDTGFTSWEDEKGDSFRIGNYVGYTKTYAFQAPVFHFEYGYCIIEDADPDNAGWHPIKGPAWRRANINRSAAERYCFVMQEYWNKKAYADDSLKAFFEDFMEGKLDAQGLAASLYFICDSGGGHLFGSKLIKQGDANHETEYTPDYFEAKLEKLKFAPIVQRLTSVIPRTITITFSGKNIGEYFGYIKSKTGSAPTHFIFEEGFYITAHTDPREIGWHPKKGPAYRAANISIDAAEEFERLAFYDYDSYFYARNKFMIKFLNGNLDEKESPDSKYFQSDSENTCLFPGRLIKVAEEDFNEKYGEDFAKVIKAKAQLAPNIEQTLQIEVQLETIQPGINTGRYIGYTLAGPARKPDLFFENGCYIQEHKVADEVGWHPKTGFLRRGANISKASAAKYREAVKKYEAEKNDDMAIAFVNVFLAGELDDNSPGCIYFESDSGGARISDSLLVKTSDNNFDKKYGDVYAKDIVTKGKVAANEKDWQKSYYYDSPDKEVKFIIGRYIGYISGNDGPSAFIFENGYYTRYKDIYSFSPRRTPYLGIHISKDSARRYRFVQDRCWDKRDDALLINFCNEICAGKFHDDKSPDRVYFEINRRRENLFAGRLIKITDADFNNNFDEVHVINLLKDAKTSTDLQFTTYKFFDKEG